MLEHAAIDVDNHELGKFIFNNLSKVVDLGIKAGEFFINPALAGLPNGTNNLSMQSVSPNSRVLLRIRYMVEAQPGIYPVLKSKEQKKLAADSGLALKNAYVFTPYPPLTVVAYNVRKYIAVEAVSTTAIPAAPAGGDKNAITPEELTDLRTWLSAMKGKDAKLTDTMVDKLIAVQNNEIKWTSSTSIVIGPLNPVYFPPGLPQTATLLETLAKGLGAPLQLKGRPVGHIELVP
jgi:hypothetical protein